MCELLALCAPQAIQCTTIHFSTEPPELCKVGPNQYPFYSNHSLHFQPMDSSCTAFVLHMIFFDHSELSGGRSLPCMSKRQLYPLGIKQNTHQAHTQICRIQLQLGIWEQVRLSNGRAGSLTIKINRGDGCAKKYSRMQEKLGQLLVDMTRKFLDVEVILAVIVGWLNFQ